VSREEEEEGQEREKVRRKDKLKWR